MEVVFLLVVALTTTMAVPVVGALLIFSLLISPAAAARSFTNKPFTPMGLSVLIALGHRLGGDRAGVPVQPSDRVLRRLDRRRDVRGGQGLGRVAAEPRSPPRAWEPRRSPARLRVLDGRRGPRLRLQTGLFSLRRGPLHALATRAPRHLGAHAHSAGKIGRCSSASAPSVPGPSG